MKKKHKDFMDTVQLKALNDFRAMYPAASSSDLRAFILGMKAMQNEIVKEVTCICKHTYLYMSGGTSRCPNCGMN